MRSSPLSKHSARSDSDEQLGKVARQKVAVGAVSKAITSLVGGIVDADASARREWAEERIPRSSQPVRACTSSEEAASADLSAWGQGDIKEALKEVRKAGKPSDGLPGIPWAGLMPLSAAGPSGERYEHLEDVLASAGEHHKRRLTRLRDDIPVRLVTNRLPTTLR
jgi:hypothetical protein